MTARGLRRQLFHHCECRYRTQKGTSNNLPAPGWGCTFGSWNNCLVTVIQAIQQCLQATTKWNRHLHHWYIADMIPASLPLHSWPLLHSVDAAVGRQPQTVVHSVVTPPCLTALKHLPSQEERPSIMSCNQTTIQNTNTQKWVHSLVGWGVTTAVTAPSTHTMCVTHHYHHHHKQTLGPTYYRAAWMRGFEQSALPQAPASTVAQHAHAS
jgi:hypothetical protein